MDTKLLRDTSVWDRMVGLLISPTFQRIVFFAVSVVLAFDFILHYGVYRLSSANIEFPSFYYGARAAFELGLSPYRFGVWRVLQKSYTGGVLYPYIYPPPSLLFFYPLSLLDYETAKVVLLALNHLLIMVFLYLFLFRILRLRPSYLGLVFVAYLYWYEPLIATIKNGQINLLMLMAICLTWYAMRKGVAPIWIALPLSIGIALKLYPVLFLPILFIRKEYKAIVLTALLLLGLSLVATLVLPDGVWHDWYVNVAAQGFSSSVRGLSIATTGNQSIHGFLSRLFFGLPDRRLHALLIVPQWVSHLTPYLVCGLVLLLSLWATYAGARRPFQDPLDLQFSLWCLVLILVAPLSWDHLLVVILPCLFLAVKRCLDRHAYWELVVWIGMAILLASDYPYGNRAFNQGLPTLLNSAKFFAVLAMWVYFLVLNFRTQAVIPDASIRAVTTG